MKTNWGILGAGNIAGKFVSDFEQVTNGKVVAVGSRSNEKSKEFAQQYSIEKAYGSYEELVNDPSIDVIYVATPHTFHFEHAMLCLRHNKHVLCEKPVTINATQFNQLIEVAKQRNLLLMEAMWTPFLPPVIKAMEWIQSGVLGEIKMIQANFGFRGNTNPEGRLVNLHLAGGSLLDIGIYPLTLAEMVAQSEIEQLDVKAIMTPSGVDETLAIQLAYKNGIFAQLASSFVSLMIKDGLIYGTKGYIRLYDFWSSKKVYIKTDSFEETFEDNRTTMGYNYEAEHVGELLLAHKTESPVMPHSRSMKMMKLMDEIRKQIGLKYPME